MPTARELLEQFFACAIRRDGAACAALFAVDGTLAFPFAKLQVLGPAAIGDRAQRTWDASPYAPARFDVGEVIESETGLTAEYIVHGTLRETGEPVRVGGIAVLDVIDGQISALREYRAPVPSPRATSRSSRACAA